MSSAVIEDFKRTAAFRQEMCDRVKEMIVTRLDLPIPYTWITNDQPLIGRGLELDSVDTLELIVGIEADFGISITDDEIEVFGSVSRLVDRIIADEAFDQDSESPGGR